MSDVLRLVLLLLILAVALAGAGAALARWRNPRRRLLRYLSQALAAEPEGVLTAPGRALAFSLEAGRLAVLWDHGRKGLVYRLEQLVGGELIIDGAVAMRTFRDEPRKALEQIPAAAKLVVLRLAFDNPLEPEYEIELWPALHGRTAEHKTLAEAIRAGRRWLTGLEALMRRPAPRAITRPAAPVALLPGQAAAPWDDEED